AGSPPPPLGGVDDSISIPAVRISRDDGARLKAILADSTVSVTIGLNGTVLSGADKDGKVLVYAPNPYESGSSVSHWDTIANPSLLMEPAINSDLTHNVASPFDLTLSMLKDIGWNPPPPPDPPTGSEAALAKSPKATRRSDK